MKTAIVTGASKGVGRATVKLLESNGYKVIAASRNFDAMKDLESDNVEINRLDVTDEKQIKLFFEKYKESTIDLLVHNAGGGAGPTLITHETMENFRRAYDINVSGPMYISQLFVPAMMKSESPTIIFISSLCGHVPFRGSGNYSNAKRGQLGLIDTMRMEFPTYGIKVTDICPGTIDTQIEKKDNALTAEDMAESIRWVSSLPKNVNINHLEISHINGSKYII
jgi:NADP-dependent 3-hydroxy acid dehydrogenase YdfG